MTTPAGAHRPALLAEVLEALRPESADTVVDGTFGLGGHSLALLSHAEQSRLLGVERDPWVLEQGQERLAHERPDVADRITLVHGSFADLDDILDTAGLRGFDAGLLDLGVNSVQVDRGHRGFQRDDDTLDLRFDLTDPMTADAATVLASWPVDDLADALWRLGGERLSRPIARALVRRREQGRPVRSARELASLVAGIYQRRGIRRQRIHPVTRTIQALRMLVNDELGHLARGLAAFLRRLLPGGRLAVISFHSGEARLVKGAFTEAVRSGVADAVDGPGAYEWISRRAVRPSAEEQRANPRCRSAQMRTVRRVS